MVGDACIGQTGVQIGADDGIVFNDEIAEREDFPGNARSRLFAGKYGGKGYPGVESIFKRQTF